MSDSKVKFTRTDSRITPEPARREPTPNVPIRTGDLPFEEWGEGARFGARYRELSRKAGAVQIHVNVMVLPPGKQSCPFHYHIREEEHFYVLSGQCILRSGEDRHVFGAGDYVCFPAGTGVAHAFENPFASECTMLAIGPWDETEVAVYPDSGKAKIRALKRMIPWPADAGSLDYWHGERVEEAIAREAAATPGSEPG